MVSKLQQQFFFKLMKSIDDVHISALTYPKYRTAVKLTLQIKNENSRFSKDVTKPHSIFWVRKLLVNPNTGKTKFLSFDCLTISFNYSAVVGCLSLMKNHLDAEIVFLFFLDFGSWVVCIAYTLLAYMLNKSTRFPYM